MYINYPEEILAEVEKHDHIVTRFPPEPNGFLHIGHGKAMTADFGLATYANSLEGKTGECILRFDDTNPGNDYEKYVDHIEENVRWLGFVPSKVTYTSDYFDELYKLAEKLIMDGNGYICELTSAEISAYRSEKKESPYKDRSIEDNLRLFREMRDGKHPEGKYCMRMKGDLNNPNPCMWDTVFYRIMHKPHPRTEDKWCIYPSYDFSHCIVDSLEGITHSLCSKEFEVRRESYYWLLDVLELRKPLVYEFARLNIDGYNLSKRYIKDLVEREVVKSWEDPALLTLEGLKNKGVTPTAIREFCESSGITKVESKLSLKKLTSILISELDASVERRVVITDPLEVHINKFKELTEYEKVSEFYNYPVYMGKIMRGDIEDIPVKYQATRPIDLTETIYINRKDFREEDEKKYYGFAPGKMARLRYNDYFKCVDYEKDGDVVTKIYLERVIPEKPKKVKGVLLWVNSSSVPVKLSTRILNNNTLTADVTMGLAEEGISEFVGRLQFEKVGYFIRGEKDAENVTFECICPLRTSYP